MARTIWRVVWVAFLVVAAPDLGLAGEVHTPRPGASERSQIISALRAAVAPELMRPVQFLVTRLNVKDDWAFVIVTPQQPNGHPYDYTGTRYETMIKEGAFDDWVCALFRRQKRGWDVIAFEIGATDVPYAGWSERFQAPADIFE